jgi:hypothetical protein
MEIMKKTKYIALLLSALSVILSVGEGCKKENMCDCLKRTGDVTTETRNIEPFTQIFIEDKVNVILTEDTLLASELKIEAGENLIPLIKTEVVNGVLRIKNANKCDFTRAYDVPVNVYVNYKPDLLRITNKGTGLVSNTDTCTAGNIDLETISAGDIKLQMSAGTVFTHQHSVGDVEVYGTVNEMIIYNTGNGFTITDQCQAGYAWVYTRSTGKITVYTPGLLISEIDGPGNVYYRGQPNQINSIENGEGRLLPLQ